MEATFPRTLKSKIGLPRDGPWTTTWNIYFADLTSAVNLYEFLKIIFADDFKDFGLYVPNSQLHAEIKTNLNCTNVGAK